MIGIATGGVINIILDPIFIFVFKMGTGGAALATIISQFISFLILYWNSGKGGNIKIKFKNFSLKWEIYKEILKGGLPSFFRQVLGSISMICLSFSARPYGDAAIAAMAIVTRLFQFAMSAVIGFGQGFQPVCGFNYGARKYERVLKAFWFSVKTAAVFLTVLSFFGFSFSRQIISIFRKEDIEVLSIGVKALRFQCITFPLSSWIIMTNMLLQTIGKGLQASIVSASRQGLFFIPAVVVLPRLFGLIGVQISQPVSDVFSFLLAVPMALSTLKELELLSKEEKSIAGLKDAI
jgi:putative MATE family efflux protein